jgi:hypothetical protein
MTMTRRTAPKTKTPRAAAKTPTRAPRGKLPITGFRIPPEVLEALDGRVDAMNAGEPIARVTRNALVVHALREYVKTAPTAAHDPAALSDSDGEGE